MKAWIFCLVVGLVLGTGSGAQGAAPAGKEVKVDGVTYELLGNGETAICASELKVKQFAIPAEITVGKQSYPVTVVKNKKEKNGEWGDVVEEITVPGSVRYIGKAAFAGQRALQRVVIEEGVQDIYSSAFSSCGALEEVVFPTTLKSIGDRAFAYCISLKEAVIPGGLQDLGYNVFWWCENLNMVNLYLTDLTQLNLGVFSGCRNLGVLFLPQHLKSVTNEREIDHQYNWGVCMSYETLLSLYKNRNTYLLNGIQVLGLSDAESIDVNVPKICPEIDPGGHGQFGDENREGGFRGQSEAGRCGVVAEFGGHWRRGIFQLQGIEADRFAFFHPGDLEQGVCGL